MHHSPAVSCSPGPKAKGSKGADYTLNHTKKERHHFSKGTENTHQKERHHYSKGTDYTRNDTQNEQQPPYAEQATSGHDCADEHFQYRG
jgi:hypothetical protein